MYKYILSFYKQYSIVLRQRQCRSKHGRGNEGPCRHAMQAPLQAYHAPHINKGAHSKPMRHNDTLWALRIDLHCWFLAFDRSWVHSHYWSPRFRQKSPENQRPFTTLTAARITPSAAWTIARKAILYINDSAREGAAPVEYDETEEWWFLWWNHAITSTNNT